MAQATTGRHKLKNPSKVSFTPAIMNITQQKNMVSKMVLGICNNHFEG